MSDWKMEREMDIRFGAASAVMWACTAGAELQGKALDLPVDRHSAPSPAVVTFG